MHDKTKWGFDDDGNDGSKRGYHDDTGWVMTLNKTRGRPIIQQPEIITGENLTPAVVGRLHRRLYYSSASLPSLESD